VPIEVIRTAGKYDPTAPLRIGHALSRHHVRVVHVHGYKASILGGVAAKLGGRTLVKTEHGRPEPFTGWGQLKMKMNFWMEGAISQRLVDSVIFVSKDIQEALKGRYPKTPQTVIYNAIRPRDAVAADGAPRLEPEGVSRIGIVGRLTPIKGHDVLLRALGRLGPRSGPELYLYVFGEGHLESALRARCTELRIEDRVAFMGFREGIHGYLSQLDILAMPSFHEGIPYAALEAMNLGVALVASDVGGLGEILENEVDALLVPPGDEEALAGAIERLASDAALRTRLGRAAQAKVNDRFLAPHMVDRYLEVYRQAVRA
jgi:glycosyltransferase involved in cell wall biosynthesis